MKSYLCQLSSLFENVSLTSESTRGMNLTERIKEEFHIKVKNDGKVRNFLGIFIMISFLLYEGLCKIRH